MPDIWASKSLVPTAELFSIIINYDKKIRKTERGKKLGPIKSDLYRELHKHIVLRSPYMGFHRARNNCTMHSHA
jgi:hypothetical protein